MQKVLAPIGLVFSFISIVDRIACGVIQHGEHFGLGMARLTSMLILCFYLRIVCCTLWTWIKNYFFAEKITNIVGISRFN